MTSPSGRGGPGSGRTSGRRLRRRSLPRARCAAGVARPLARADRPVAGVSFGRATRSCGTAGSAGCGRTSSRPSGSSRSTALHRNQMMENEPPAHTRLRSLVAKAFARGHVERLRPRVQQMADELLRASASAAGFDLIEDFAEPLPVAVIAELLGVPGRTGTCCGPGRRRSWGCTSTAAPRSRGRRHRRVRGVRRLHARPGGQRRAEPRDDLVSHLVARRGAAVRCCPATSWWPRRSCCSTPGTRRRSTRSATAS